MIYNQPTQWQWLVATIGVWLVGKIQQARLLGEIHQARLFGEIHQARLFGEIHPDKRGNCSVMVCRLQYD